MHKNKCIKNMDAAIPIPVLGLRPDTVLMYLYSASDRKFCFSETYCILGEKVFFCSKYSWNSWFTGSLNCHGIIRHSNRYSVSASTQIKVLVKKKWNRCIHVCSLTYLNSDLVRWGNGRKLWQDQHLSAWREPPRLNLGPAEKTREYTISKRRSQHNQRTDEH